MSGSLRFESTSASSEELGYTNNSYSNGHKGSYLGSSLGRSGSFRESNENRVFGSGLVSRGPTATVTGELPPLSQCLALEPITIGDRKFNRSGEVKRFLGFSYGTVTEDNPIGSIHARSPPPVAQVDIKRFKASVVDTSLKARGRKKKLDESLHKLNKYYDAINSQKHQRNELLTNEKSSGSASLKNGAQMHRNLSEDRSKNTNLNKRVRTAVADNRSEGRNNATPRQNLVPGKDRDVLKESSAGSDILEEKNRKLPAGGEGWDQRMKRKRSAGTVFLRSGEDDTELKKPASQKINSDSSPHILDIQGDRSGSLTGTSSLKEGIFSVGVKARGIAKTELEKVSFIRDSTSCLGNERAMTKGNNNKANNRMDDHIMSSSPQIRGKGSRAPRTGPINVASSTPNNSRSSGAAEGWDQPSSVNKFQSLNGNNSRKRPSVSGSPPMAQWVGQRPQKIQRNRRANLVSPVSKHDDMQTSSEGFSPDTGGWTNSSSTNLSPQMKGVPNGFKQMKVKHEFVPSPGLVSESEESGAGDNKIEDKGKISSNLDRNLLNSSQQLGSSLQPVKKDKSQLKGDNGDGVRRQGRNGRGSQTVRSNASPANEKSESETKSARNAKPGFDKSGSKPGRPPLKKSLDRNKFTRLGQIPNGGYPDCTVSGDSDDDREELLAVAEFVRDSSSVMCANSFWKQMEKLHEYVRSGDEDAHYLEQELKSSEQRYDNLWKMLKCEVNAVGNDDVNSVPLIIFSEEKQSNMACDVTMMSARTADVVDNFEDNSIFNGNFKEFPPLYQRVLSALIVEDESEQLDEAYGEGEGPLHLSRDAFPSSTNHSKDDMDFEYDTIMGCQVHKQLGPDYELCNGNSVFDGVAGVHPSLCNGKETQKACGAMYKANESNPRLLDVPLRGCPYDLMHIEERLLLELHSIGLYPETVPHLSEDDKVINEEIYAIKKGLFELVDKKRLHLKKACKAIQEEKEREGYLEQLAMDRLTEVAYRKLLATRGSSSSKNGPTKISKQIASSFVKRTLARCHNFEAFRKSCFGDSPFRDILVCPRVTVADPTHSSHSGLAPNSGEWHGLTETHHDEASGRNGPMFNRGKKKEVLLDDVGATSLRASAALGSHLLGAGAKGKRSERDARNSSVKNGRQSLGISKSERQPKSKPKQQKSSQHPTSGFPGGFVHNTGNGPTEVASIRKRNTGPTYANSGTVEQRKTSNGQMDLSNLPLHDLESIEDVSTVLGEHQDLDAWLNFDDDGLPEHDALDTMDLSCLEIPMDDLSDLNMIL